jgi:hypothetical protein
MNIQKAVKTVVNEMESDPSYRLAWQANIAVQFMDELQRRGVKLEDAHGIANEAAKNFLDLLCMDVNKD